MLKLQVVCEARSPVLSEEIRLRAKTVGGQTVPERTWTKRIVHAEIGDHPCVVKLRDGARVVGDIRKGVEVMLSVVKMDNEGDIATLTVDEVAVMP